MSVNQSGGGWSARRVMLTLLTVLVGLGVLGGVIAGAVAYDRNTKKAEALWLEEFEFDLVTKYYAQDPRDPNLVVVWKKETDCHGGTCTAEKELDATVQVAGCTVQLERSEAATKGKSPVRNGAPGMKDFKLDEYVDGSKDGLDLTEPGRGRDAFTTNIPSARQVYDYIKRYKDTVFKKCFSPNAAIPVG